MWYIFVYKEKVTTKAGPLMEFVIGAWVLAMVAVFLLSQLTSGSRKYKRPPRSDYQRYNYKPAPRPPCRKLLAAKIAADRFDQVYDLHRHVQQQTTDHMMQATRETADKITAINADLARSHLTPEQQQRLLGQLDAALAEHHDLLDRANTLAWDMVIDAPRPQLPVCTEWDYFMDRIAAIREFADHYAR